MRLADLDCVTVDAYRTLVALEDPVPVPENGLRRHGATRSLDEAALETALKELSE
jgi:hypothetical protein